MKKAMLILFLIFAEGLIAMPVKEDTAVTILVGPFVDYADGKTILSDNDDFDPNDIVCRLIKGSSESTLTLTKTGGDNNINLTGYGMATLTLTTANVDTSGQLQLQFCDAESGGYLTETILPFAKSFTVYPSNVYDSLFTDNTAISKFDASSDTVTTDTASRTASKADVSGLSTFDSTTDPVTVGNPNDCKADVSGLATPANVRTQVDDSMEYYRLDHLLLTGGTLTDFVTDQSVFAWLMTIGGDISDSNDVTDSLEGLRDQIDQIPTKPSRPSIGGR